MIILGSHRTRNRYLGAIVSLCSLGILGCDSDAAQITGPDIDLETGSLATGTDSVDPTTGGGADASDTGEADSGQTTGPGSDTESTCVTVESMAESTLRRADILLMVDSGASMGPAREQVIATIDQGLDQILAASGIDYRVILIADPAVIQFSGALAQYNPPRLFPVNIQVGSAATPFGTMLREYSNPIGSDPPWSTHLREDAVKIIMEFTDAEWDLDDQPQLYGYRNPPDLEFYMQHPDQFGSSAADGKLVFHAVIGLAANTPPDAPYLPADPVVATACSSPGVQTTSGEDFQKMAIRTGGLRFPVCEFDDYSAIFNAVAESVLTVAAAQCDFLLPDPPVGEVLDLDTVALRYFPGDGTEELLLRADSEMECAQDRFLLDEVAETIALCPDACSRVENNESPNSAIKVEFGCDPLAIE